MTHLKIELSTSGTEQVSSYIILKLYNIVHDNNIDQVSNLIGRMHSNYAYAQEIQYLTNSYNDLYITADTLYFKFDDAEIESFCISRWGDEIGVPIAYANQLGLEDNFYGIKWTDSRPTPVRIGNTMLHINLPILKRMRRCMLRDNGTVYKYISSVDPTKYEDGTTVDYTGTDGLCMVEIPNYYFEASTYEENGENVYTLKLYPDTTTGTLSKKVYIGAFEAMSDDSNSSLAVKKLYSISNTNFTIENNQIDATSFTYDINAENYRGGNARSNSTNDSAINSLLGRPVTSLSRSAFRTRASNRGIGWSLLYWDAYMAAVRLYVVEYCNFNSQAQYYQTLDEVGLTIGGLGAGVNNINSTEWNNFNIYNPIIPCGVTKSLGNSTGVVSVIYSEQDFTYTLNVPSYRGIENPFSHIWKWMDGININNIDGTLYIYTSSNVLDFADDTSVNYTERISFALPSDGYIKKCNWDSNGDFIPTTTGASSNSYFYDYFSSSAGLRALVSGGSASLGAACGWFYFGAGVGSSAASANFGGRLYYTPQ